MSTQELRYFLTLFRLLKSLFAAKDLPISVITQTATGALFIEMVTGWSKYTSIFALLVVTCSISIGGGLTAIMYIDALQALLMVTGAFVLFGVCVRVCQDFLANVKLITLKPEKSLKEANITSVQSFQLAYLNTTYNLDHVVDQFNFTKDYKSNISRLYQKCAPPPDDTAFKLLRPVDDPTSPWLSWLVGCNAVSLWYWCTDQLMVQRTLSVGIIIWDF